MAEHIAEHSCRISKLIYHNNVRVKQTLSAFCWFAGEKRSATTTTQHNAEGFYLRFFSLKLHCNFYAN